MKKIPLIIDTDFTKDDIVAIAMAAASDKFDIKAITCYGEWFVETVALRNSLGLDSAVCWGAMKPLFRQQNDAEILMVEFKKQIALSKVQTNPYRCVLAWFKQTFQNYDSYKAFFAEEAKKKAQEKNIFTVVNSSAAFVEDAADEYDEEFDFAS